MASPTPPDVDAYLAAQPQQARPVLDQVRAALRAALPEAVEVITYGMPTYRVDGQAVVAFAGWKKGYALYIVPSALFAEIADQLSDREIGKGIIRFGFDEALPDVLLQHLSAWRPAPS